MYTDWQSQINVELRALRREEAREQMSTEDRLLRAGRLEQPAVAMPPRPGATVQRSWLALRRVLVTWWGTRHAPLGVVVPTVTASAGRRIDADRC